MNSKSTSQEIPISVLNRAAEMLSIDANVRNRSINIRFVWLLLVQWIVAVAAAIWLTPYTWSGADRSVHPHVWVATVLGGLAIMLPIWFALKRPDDALTRHCIAIGQMLIGCVFIHLLGGRLEGHFHVFGSLAFLSAYRDWRVLVTGSIVVALDHIVRGIYFPMSMYGVQSGAEWRWLEHAGWVIFEDAFLIMASVQALREMANSSLRQAQLEYANDTFEHAVKDRTSELLAMTDQLRGSEERYRSLWEQATDPKFIIDKSGMIVDVNIRGCESLGFTRDEIVGNKFTRFNPSIDLKTVLETIAVAQQPTTICSFHRRKDQSIFPVEICYRRYDIDDQAFGLLNCRDITERSKAEAALRTSEERHRQLFDSIPHPMYVFEADSKKLLAVNDAAVMQYGYTREEFLEMKTSDVELPGERKVRKMGDAESGVVSTVRLSRHRLKSGEVCQVEVADHPFMFDGKPAFIALAIDVTDKVNLENTLKQAQKLESIGQLAAGIAHEINTPIQYIGDNTTFLSDAFQDLFSALQSIKNEVPDFEFLTTEVPKAVEQTLDGVKQVSRIVKAMKDFAHPGTEEKTPLDLNRAIDNVVTVAKNEWKYFAEVVTDLDPLIPPVPALPGELNQVFLNLLVNAVHAIQAAGKAGLGKITIATKRIGNSVEVRLTDSGSGIPERIRDRIFDPFFTTKPVGQGTGQGLSIAHSVVVQRHGGSISFETELGVGTTFIVSLPLISSTQSRSGRIPMISMTRVPTPSPDVKSILEVSI